MPSDSELERQIWETALGVLGRRAHTVRSLRDRLEKRFSDQRLAEAGHDPGDRGRLLEAALARLGELGLVDDEAYARDWVARRVAQGRYGRHRIAQELLRRGVGEASVETALSQGFESETEQEAARRALADFQARRGPLDAANTAAAARHLEGRGFPYGLIRDLLGCSL